MHPRARELIATLRLAPHPEGGFYRETWRSPQRVIAGARPERSAITTIYFLLAAGGFSAWHRVQSDEVWHLLEGESLTLWLMPPELGPAQQVTLSRATRLRHVVPAYWWQAAAPGGDFAYVGATVGPGFDFADFAFGREDAAFKAAAEQQGLARLL